MKSSVSGDSVRSDQYRRLALLRGDAIHALFWNSTRKMWRDFDLQTNHQRETFYLSGIVPLYVQCNGNVVDITSAAFMKDVLTSPDVSIKHRC